MAISACNGLTPPSESAQARNPPSARPRGWEPELDEPLAVDRLRHLFQDLDAAGVVLDEVVVGGRMAAMRPWTGGSEPESATSNNPGLACVPQ
jgi:hypothetical protein